MQRVGKPWNAANGGNNIRWCRVSAKALTVHARLTAAVAHKAQRSVARYLLYSSRMRWQTFLQLSLIMPCVSGCSLPILDWAKELDAEESPCDARATTQIAIAANLDAQDAIGSAWDPNDPDATSSFSLEGRAYSKDGAELELRFYLAHEQNQVWAWHILQACETTELGSGALTFDAEGALTDSEQALPLRLPLKDGSFGDAIALSFDEVTSTDQATGHVRYEQDGHPPNQETYCLE